MKNLKVATLELLASNNIAYLEGTYWPHKSEHENRNEGSAGRCR